MAKAGVDEENIVATIHDATSVQFDLTPDGLVDLASNGVKGKIVAAMRERAKRCALALVAQAFSLSAFAENFGISNLRKPHRQERLCYCFFSAIPYQ